SIDEARATQKGEREQITIGCEFISSLGSNELWQDNMALFLADHPDVNLHLHVDNLSEIKSGLVGGAFDAIIGCCYPPDDPTAQYMHAVINTVPMYLYARNGNPFLQTLEDGFDWCDFKDQEFITTHVHISPKPQDILVMWCEQHGFTPKIGTYTENQLSQLLEIKTSDKWLLSLGLDVLLNDPALTAIPADGGTYEIEVVWRQDAREIIDTLADYLKQQEPIAR
ncbi:MAG: substrate-binding domain-containing protein, partial [Oscillospiraceae bacterium]|nr:substrate-binding domain-containing protein [Oscillospiraceae bacterium]